jgi:uncharacterized membrane protein
MSFNPAEKNAFQALEQLVRMSKIRVTSQTLKNTLWQHPDFPSLVALSDALNEVNVPNLATRITPERLSEIPLPALAHLNIEGGFFAPIRRISDDTVEWLHTKRGWQKQSWSDFNRIWNGVTLLIEPNPESGEMKYAENRQKEQIANSRYPFIIVGILVCLSLMLGYGYQQIRADSDQPLFWLLGLKVIGTIVSGFLLAYTIDSDNPFLRSICQLGNRTNCHSILNSKAAKLWSWLSWSEIGFVYFAGGFVASLLSLLIPTSSVVQYLLWLNVLALPYTVYSLYYQAFVAKEFCILCTAVQVILWLEVYVGRTLWNTVSLAGIGVLLFSFTLVIVLWAFMEKPLIQAKQAGAFQREFEKIKFNPDYLESLSNKQRMMPPIFEGMKVVTLGKPEAKNTLLVITNPTCEACRSYYKAIEKTIQTYHDIHVQIILAISPYKEDTAGNVAVHILSLPSDKMSTALSRWFELGETKYTQWLQEVEKDYKGDTKTEQLTLHLRWLELAGVDKIPVSFLNSIELPKFYSPHELPKLCTLFTNLGIGQFT